MDKDAPGDWSALQRAQEKHQRQQDALRTREGEAATAAGQAVIRNYIGEFAEALGNELQHKGKVAHRVFLAVIRDLDREVLALCILWGAQHSIGMRENLRDTALRIGGLIADECWAQGLTKRDPKLAKEITKRAQALPTKSSERRKKYARTLAERSGYRSKDWSTEHLAAAGAWALDVLIRGLRDVFLWQSGPRTDGKGGDDLFLTFTDAALKSAASLTDQIIKRNLVWLPSASVPKPWVNWDEGGTWNRELARTLSIVRARGKGLQEAVRRALAAGKMEAAVDALNALQSVPWTINKQVHSVMLECARQGIKVPGVPASEPPLLKDRAANKFDKAEFLKDKLKLISKLALFNEDMRTAEHMAKLSRFWTFMNFDFRGRIYSGPSFNLQREDYVRALFKFADGAPIGGEGIYWLKVHLANCGFGGISKQPFQARIEWVDAHREKIRQVATAPLDAVDWWKQADEPFQFLAACFELNAALSEGPSYVSRLPIYFDGSCNGLQHLCAMTRAPEGFLVNLSPQRYPQDIYREVADRVRKRVEHDLGDNELRQLARMCLDWVWADGQDDRPRKTLKRNVMTYAYSSQAWGMTAQLREDTMERLSMRVRSGELGEHPFGHDRGFAASNYLARHTFEEIQATVKGPAQAMEFLQKVTRALSAAGKQLRWTTPTGFPLINCYQEKETKRVRLWLNAREVQVKLATDENPRIDKMKAANAVAPNVVHACDAAHLMLTVNAAVSEGITSIATVHDSFGCLAPDAPRFREIIREQFVRLYEEHDVLKEVLDQARVDLGEDSKGLPEKPPDRGDLDIHQVRDAEYAFA
jgi:DNA-directed RNA polymerase